MARGNAKGTKGIQRLSVPASFPYGTVKIDTIAPSTGIYGKRVGGTPPINAARVRGTRRRTRRG